MGKYKIIARKNSEGDKWYYCYKAGLFGILRHLKNCGIPVSFSNKKYAIDYCKRDNFKDCHIDVTDGDSNESILIPKESIYDR